MTMSKRDSEDSINKIENAALRLFASRGYSNTSLEQVANEAGFTKGAVYYHFKSKELLLLYLLNRISERSILKTRAHIEAMQSNAVQKLVALVSMQANWAANHPDDLSILILTSLQFRNSNTKITDTIQNYYSVSKDMLTRIFTEGMEKGELAASLDVNAAVMTNMARHDGNMLLWYRSGCDPDVGRILTASAVDAVKRYAAV